MDIRIIKDKITVVELRELAKIFHVLMIKGVVDLKRKVIAFGGEYHIDANNVLVDNGSNQSDLWGFNAVFNKPRDSWIEYTSLINIRPQAGNLNMEVQDETIRGKMKGIINSIIS